MCNHFHQQLEPENKANPVSALCKPHNPLNLRVMDLQGAGRLPAPALLLASPVSAMNLIPARDAAVQNPQEKAE